MGLRVFRDLSKNNEKNWISSQVGLRSLYEAIFFKRELFRKDHIISIKRASNESMINAFRGHLIRTNLFVLDFILLLTTCFGLVNNEIWNVLWNTKLYSFEKDFQHHQVCLIRCWNHMTILLQPDFFCTTLINLNFYLLDQSLSPT